MVEANGYVQHPRAKVVRKRDRAAYDYETIHRVFQASRVVHVAFQPSDDDPFPAILPMIGCIGAYENQDAGIDEPHDLYLHGYVSARMFRKSQDSTDASGGDEGLPVAISATKVDGIVLALTPFNHSYNYRSCVLHGYASPVTDIAEKEWAMKRVTDAVMEHRWDNSRTPATKTELTTTGMLKVRVVSASAKIRKGPPGDDRHDLKNSEVTKRVWTGVLPLSESLGSPVVQKREDQPPIPQYIRDFVDTENQESEKALEESLQGL